MGIPAGFGADSGPTPPGFGPQPALASQALADATTEIRSFTLRSVRGGAGGGQISQVVVRVQEDVSVAAIAESGPIWAELWLARASGLAILLDKGYVRGGSIRGLHSVIGFVGKVTYTDGDLLVVHAANFSGAAVAYRMDIQREPAFQEGTFAFTPLSSEHEAQFTYQATIVNGAGGAGDHSYAIAPGEGDELILEALELLNGDAAARTATIIVDDGTNRLYPLAGDLSVGAGARYAVPAGETLGTNRSSVPTGAYTVRGPNRILVTLAAVALSQDSALGLSARIRGRPPTVTEAGASTPTITINTERVD